MAQVSPFQKFDSLVFDEGDGPHSGQFISDENGCGMIVMGWADGRTRVVAHEDIRPETDAEHHARTIDGYYAEHRSGNRGG